MSRSFLRCAPVGSFIGSRLDDVFRNGGLQLRN
jgi:hypothetical protein